MIRILFISFLLSISTFAEVTNQTKDQAILVLDVSGSMWGVIDGKSKIEIAREVVSDLLKSWPAERNLGLVAYGHRTKGDCKDIETLVDVKKLEINEFTNKVFGLTPKGKTPMVASIQHAAEELKYSEEPATVILISDGEETCEANPCNVALELEKLGINFTAHVIGFDLKNASPQAAEQMKCIAENTGGRFFTADNAIELSAALEQATVAKEPVVQKPKNNLIATASLTADSAPIKTGLAWSVYSLGENNEKLEQVNYSFDDIYQTSLNPGKYLLEVKHETNVASKIIELTEELQEVHFVIGAGILKLKGLATENEKLSKDLSWKIDSLDGQVSTYSYKPEPEFTLQPGKYKIKLGWGDAEKENEIVVKAGETTEHQIVIGAGILRPKAYASEGGEQLTKKLNWTVHRLVSALENNYEQLAYSFNAEPEFRLLAGNYQLKAKWGEAETSKDITVVAGTATSADLVLNAGVLKLAIKNLDGTLVTNDLSWSIFSKEKSLTDNNKLVAYSFNAEPEFFLAAGEYRIEVKTKDGVIKSEVDITAGGREEVSLDVTLAVPQ